MKIWNWLFTALTAITNGNGTATSNHKANPQASEAQPAVGPATKSGDGPLMRLQTDLYTRGWDRAVSSGALQPREADIRSLKEHAEAMARETRRGLYDPKNREQHRLRDFEHKKLIGDRAEAEDAVKFSAAAVRDREAALAKLPALERPAASPLLACGVIVGISGTVTPTLHDFLFSMVEDSVLGWSLSFLSALFLALVIVLSILCSIDATGRRTIANWAGLAAGITVSVGLGLFRLAGATESEDILFAIALTVVEIGLVILPEWVALGLRAHYREWLARQDARNEAMAALAAARSDHQRRQDHLDKLNHAIKEHIDFIADLELRQVNLRDLIRTAVKAVLDGYNAGIANNRGHVLRAGGAQL
jgi:hypothetical protein